MVITFIYPSPAHFSHSLTMRKNVRNGKFSGRHDSTKVRCFRLKLTFTFENTCFIVWYVVCILPRFILYIMFRFEWPGKWFRRGLGGHNFYVTRYYVLVGDIKLEWNDRHCLLFHFSLRLLTKATAAFTWRVFRIEVCAQGAYQNLSKISWAETFQRL